MHCLSQVSPGAQAAEDGDVPVPILRRAHDRQVEVQDSLVPHQAPNQARRVSKVANHLKRELLQPGLFQHASATKKAHELAGGRGGGGR